MRASDRREDGASHYKNMTWEECSDEISKTVLIAAKDRGFLTPDQEQHIIRLSKRAVIEAQKDDRLEEYDL